MPSMSMAPQHHAMLLAMQQQQAAAPDYDPATLAQLHLLGASGYPLEVWVCRRGGTHVVKRK